MNHDQSSLLQRKKNLKWFHLRIEDFNSDAARRISLLNTSKNNIQKVSPLYLIFGIQTSSPFCYQFPFKCEAKCPQFCSMVIVLLFIPSIQTKFENLIITQNLCGRFNEGTIQSKFSVDTLLY